eukprot:CAMPEP_0175111658 /NCGR_PEP_ID=MMETSP0086_2-20121207/14950_1 /TAXON_ID=136419 /ORGANISM="Unknown Unknown, Strain D1" /LENGTH=89 /DNA_ID=CAMNT_0016390275 /DNA_START=31 /DNA_END=296 /DNA_ORIENTATION=-
MSARKRQKLSEDNNPGGCSVLTDDISKDQGSIESALGEETSKVQDSTIAASKVEISEDQGPTELGKETPNDQGPAESNEAAKSDEGDEG